MIKIMAQNVRVGDWIKTPLDHQKYSALEVISISKNKNTVLITRDRMNQEPLIEAMSATLPVWRFDFFLVDLTERGRLYFTGSTT